ncbi:penicillin acylase family protein [Acidisphaera sp. L21]|uniref:penicillin acylase family protein n=1 Tax=Acidisphaera sp. L21 TaxID=1641851 RepID=UPI00131E960F|nr:penicillin acylase family protein [Acidisphaera sp. L21]
MRALRLLRRIGGVLTVLVLLAAVAVVGVAFLCLPSPHGEAQIPGLTAPVSIAFDGNGIPHIRAATAEDGAAALGFVHARDRMFQMDLMRRAASGRISELAGSRALPLDRMMRVLGLRHQAELEMATIPAQTRAMLEAYSRGVNAYLDAKGRWSALQFAVLGRPEPWTAVDSLLWGKTMGIYLSGNWRSELSRLAQSASVPRDVIDQMWPTQDTTPAPSASLLPSSLFGLAGAVDAFMPRFPDPFTLPDEASNEWAVDGAHSDTGAPLLAGDPHLGFSTPGIWYLARIDTPDATLAGAFAPGVPFLVIGRTGKIAWTFTTTGADTQDVFVETVLPDGRYLTPSGPAAFTTRTEHIVVHGAPAEDIVIRESRHGPVVSDIPGLAAPAGAVFTAQMANLSPGDDAATGLLALNRASSVTEAQHAAPLITSPIQNLLVADATEIGQFTTGRIPVRKAGDGEWPQQGADGAHDWVGWASGDALPHVVAPTSGRIVNTNERVAPPDFPVFMGRDFYGDWRAQRVRTLFGSEKQSVGDFAAIQMDVTSSFAQHILPILLARPRKDDLAGHAAGLLAGWDGRMGMELPQPIIFNAWVQRFEALLLERHGIGPNAPRPWADLVAWALSPAGASWCNGDCGPLLDQALAEALPPLVARLGPDLQAWRWGDLHVATFADPVLPQLTNQIAQPGDDTTIFRGGSRPGNFDSVHGPGYRGVYDLADLDRSLFMTAPGQSGNPLSPHFRDLLLRWRDGGTIRLGRHAEGGHETLALHP